MRKVIGAVVAAAVVGTVVGTVGTVVESTGTVGTVVARSCPNIEINPLTKACTGAGPLRENVSCGVFGGHVGASKDSTRAPWALVSLTNSAGGELGLILSAQGVLRPGLQLPDSPTSAAVALRATLVRVVGSVESLHIDGVFDLQPCLGHEQRGIDARGDRLVLVDPGLSLRVRRGLENLQ